MKRRLRSPEPASQRRQIRPAEIGSAQWLIGALHPIRDIVSDSESNLRKVSKGEHGTPLLGRCCEIVDILCEMISTPVTTLSDLTKQVFAACESSKSRWWFRGQRVETWDLQPGIARGYSTLQERYMTNLFYSRARLRHRHCPPSRDYGAWLALMQHYRLPTRLLDWSSSPLVAAYFATKLAFDLARKPDVTDAAIWLLAPERLNEFMGYGAVYPPLNAVSVRPLVMPAFKKRKEATIRALAVMPLEDDMRMFVQQGSFTIHTTDEALNKLPGCDAWIRKLIIPRDAVGCIACELDLLGFRLADIFPDLDSLAKEITNMHHS